jgi:hypothetical protein
MSISRKQVREEVSSRGGARQRPAVSASHLCGGSAPATPPSWTYRLRLNLRRAELRASAKGAAAPGRSRSLPRPARQAAKNSSLSRTPLPSPAPPAPLPWRGKPTSTEALSMPTSIDPLALLDSNRTGQGNPSFSGPDPWVVAKWICTAICQACDGCAAPDADVMRVRGGNDVAICERCHNAFMDAWRLADAESERAEILAAYTWS